MLYIIGLGLGDERDITLRGLEAVKKCSKVFIEAYTSLLSFGLSSNGLSTLENLYGKPITLADREMVEEKRMIFCPMLVTRIATTHSDLVVRAKKLGVDVKVVHNASVMNAIGICGLQLYRYGETISIPFFTETWRPDSFYEKIQRNRVLGLHTLCLLAFCEDTDCVGFARLGSEDQMIVAGSMRQLFKVDFGAPLHCLVIVGKTHPVEEEMLDFYKLKGESAESEHNQTA
ncbi:putative diphthine methyl ester synthase [Vitis vinifera]|uniref:diphthine methyl ester synthase n=1 Tax=Vitis vinifera TaxID=29760 RepID=A0A438J2U8_VITVI|nr:putative diphthine methyl ester synthase [Vitis vinifera]